MLSNVIPHSNLSSLTGFERTTSLNGIILLPRKIINKNQRTKRLIQFKESMKKLSSKFSHYLKKKIRLYTYIFNRNLYSLICFERETCLRGIILPETSFTSLNDISRDAFPFDVPFHPGHGPEIDYPDGPVEPEDPDEDPGDEPGDSK